MALLYPFAKALQGCRIRSVTGRGPGSSMKYDGGGTDLLNDTDLVAWGGPGPYLPGFQGEGVIHVHGVGLCPAPIPSG